MQNLLIIFILLTNIVFAHHNKIVIKNRNGTVVKNRKIKHKRNRFFNDLKRKQRRLLSKIRKRNRKKSKYIKNRLVRYAKKYLGGRYVWGGTKPSGFDCSGYIRYLYAKEGIKLPRTAYAQSKVGRPISKANLKKGDLLFFLTDKKRHIPITHVGMYIGNGKFIHAASREDGIIISSLFKGKYKRFFVKAKRVINSR